ncbi:MAG: hypothetical protein LLG37_00790 [Spirochaetia bacterium]|nr:hypothetical protein [Spirochaetia bacterium]
MKKLFCVAIITAAAFVMTVSGCRKAADIMPADIPTPIPLAVYPISILIDNMDDNNNTNEWGGIWFTYDDTKPPNFGISTVIPRNGATFTMSAVGPDWNSILFGSNLYAAMFKGYVNRVGLPSDFEGTNGAVTDYPLIGVGCTLNISETPLDIRSYTKLVFYAKNPLYKTSPNTDAEAIWNYTVSFKNSFNTKPDIYPNFVADIGPNGIDNSPTRNLKLTNEWTKIIIPISKGSIHPGWATDYPIGLTTTTTDEGVYWEHAFSHTQSIQIQTNTTEGNGMLDKESQAVELWIDNVMLIRD